MFSKKYKRRIAELEAQLESTKVELGNVQRENEEYRKDNIYLSGRVRQLTKELEILPKRNSKGQYERRRKPVTV
jgi:predicted nuclease with TOPRIM domain